MVDIHNHSLYGVDDGAENKETSIAMLKKASQQGIDTVILTPHYRHGMFAYPVEKIRENYHELFALGEQMGILLYLGCEYHMNSRIVEYLRSGRCLTLAGSSYVLTEFDYEVEYHQLYDQIKMLLMAGYIPVIAHVERYICIQKKTGLCQELSETGAWLQLNAGSILGKEGRKAAGVCKTILKHQWADVIASDAHGTDRRPCYMAECRAYIMKKYGSPYAEALFETNPHKILNSIS